VPENYRAAVEWFRRAADQGYLEAQNALGDLYDAYVGANLIEVHKWYNLAAIAGDSKAERKRDEVEKKMTLEQVFEAQKLAAEWKPKLEVPDTK
jgi:TPR repeat protein